MERPSPPFGKILVVAPKMLDCSLDFSKTLEDFDILDSSCLMSSLEACSILSPLLVIRQEEGLFLVIDGFRRLRWAREGRLTGVPIIETGPFEWQKLLVFILAKYAERLKSCAIKAIFLNYLVDAGFPVEMIVEEAMEALCLQGHRGLLEKHLKVARLPKKILKFCHQKDISLKRCLNLAHQPEQLLNRIADMQDKISLSASLLLELCDNISAIVRREEMEVDAFFESPDVKRLLSEEMDKSKRTKLFRNLVRLLSHPVLSRTQRELYEIKQAHFKKCPFEVKWDETLENRRIQISASLTDVSQLSELQEALSNENAKKGLERLLSYF